MKYLIIEDDLDKLRSIYNHIYTVDTFAKIDKSDNLTDGRRLLLTNSYDLIIFDIYLPNTRDTPAQDISNEIINDFSQSRNYHAEAIVITKYNDSSVNTRPYNDHGVTVVTYSESDCNWKVCLKHKIQKILAKPRCDFLIFCALNKERSSYAMSNAKLGELKIISGLNCQEITIDHHKGLCITPSRMGLVGMAIAATKGIELFQPKIAAMSGICAGVSGEANLLDLLIGDVCWEYQTGKFNKGKFKQEPYQVQLNNLIKTELEQLVEDQLLLDNLKFGLCENELKDSIMKIVPISSGSAVIADETKMNEIGLQHRKMAGVEMEMYSLYAAAAASLCSPIYFGAKAVVDMGDSTKGDTLHTTACILSARFVVAYITKRLSC